MCLFSWGWDENRTLGIIFRRLPAQLGRLGSPKQVHSTRLKHASLGGDRSVFRISFGDRALAVDGLFTLAIRLCALEVE
jgi:hypothetical protein